MVQPFANFGTSKNLFGYQIVKNKIKSLEITIVGTGLLIGFVISWALGLSGGDVFIWIFCLYLGLEVGKIIFSDDSNDDDDDFDGGLLNPIYQGI